MTEDVLVGEAVAAARAMGGLSAVLLEEGGGGGGEVMVSWGVWGGVG